MKSEAEKLPRVAVLLSGREQFSSRYGGAVARWTYEVYRRCERVEPTVFCFPTDALTAYSLPHESSWAWVASTTIGAIPVVRRYEEKLWLWALRDRLRKFGIVHIHNRPQWVGILRRLSYEGAIVLHLHNDHLGHWTAPALDSLAGQLDAVAVCSGYLRSTFAEKSAALAAKTRIVFNGANLEIFFPREEVREPKTILFAGRLDEEKGVLQLLRAYERVIESHPDARLVIGGAAEFGRNRETDYVRRVRELADDLMWRKGASIQFTGYLDHDRELPGWFQKATVFACPSLFEEPFGMVNAEALACATPVVGAKRGGIPEVVGDAGKLVNPEDAREFGDAISSLLSDPQECRRLGCAGYERCRTIFDWNVTAENWTALLESALQERTAENSRSISSRT